MKQLAFTVRSYHEVCMLMAEARFVCSQKQMFTGIKRMGGNLFHLVGNYLLLPYFSHLYFVLAGTLCGLCFLLA